jgi:hypothetical protein
VQPIETDRLTLRNFTALDGPALLEKQEQYQASTYAKYDHQWPTDPEKIRGVAKWFAEGDAYLAVWLKETNAFIGFEGEIAAVTIPTPTVRFVEEEPDLVKALQLCCQEIDIILGGRRLSSEF